MNLTLLIPHLGLSSSDGHQENAHYLLVSVIVSIAWLGCLVVLLFYSSDFTIPNVFHIFFCLLKLLACLPLSFPYLNEKRQGVEREFHPQLPTLQRQCSDLSHSMFSLLTLPNSTSISCRLPSWLSCPFFFSPTGCFHSS